MSKKINSIKPVIAQQEVFDRFGGLGTAGQQGTRVGDLVYVGGRSQTTDTVTNNKATSKSSQKTNG